MSTPMFKNATAFTVIPAKAGIQSLNAWTPAFAGVTHGPSSAIQLSAFLPS